MMPALRGLLNSLNMVFLTVPIGMPDPTDAELAAMSDQEFYEYISADAPGI